MVVHSYMSTGAFDGNRSLAKFGVAIVPPSTSTRDDLLLRIRTATGMNAAYAELCLNQNDWDFDRALANFQELKPGIPEEAYK